MRFGDDITRRSLTACVWIALVSTCLATPLKKRWHRELPAGVAVELVGVGPRQDGVAWWKPDGSPMEQPPPGESNSRFPEEPGRNAVVLAAVVWGASDDATILWNVERSRRLSTNSTAWPLAGGGLRRASATLPLEVEESTVKVGVASGPWEVVASTRGIGSSGQESGEIGVLFSRARGSQEECSIVVSDTIKADADTKVVAIDQDGHEHDGSGSTTVAISKVRQRDLDFNLPLARVARFEFKTRPFHWAEFTDVRVKPGPAPKKAAAAAPAGEKP